MSFVDVEAEEEGVLNQREDSGGSSSDADTSLSGFICEDDSADSPSGQLPSQNHNVARGDDHWSDNEEAQMLRAASGSSKNPSVLFDPNESADSVDSGAQSSTSSQFEADECDAPREFLGGSSRNNNGLLSEFDKREVQIDNATLELPPYTDSISVVLPDGLCADMEVEPYEIWRRSSAKPITHPSLDPSKKAKCPADWFDELRLCKDRRGAYGIRSTRKVIAGSSRVRFPAGNLIEVPTKRVVVEHTFFPYDPAIWEQPASYRLPQQVPLESSDEDLVEFADKAKTIGRPSLDVISPNEGGGGDDCVPDSKKSRISSKKASTPQVELSNARGKKKTAMRSPASRPLPASSEKEVATAGYILSESQSEAEHQSSSPVPKTPPVDIARARMSTTSASTKNAYRHQDVLQRPAARIKAHTTALQTTKQKKRRQRRLDLMRLKRDLLEETTDLGQLWSLSERRTKRQARNEHARKMTTAHTLAEARGAAYNFLLPG